MIVYDLENRLLKLNRNKYVKLSEIEHKFLIAISNEQYISYKDISEYIYGAFNKYTNEKVNRLRCMTCAKTGLRISTIEKYKMKLNSVIYYK